MAPIKTGEINESIAALATTTQPITIITTQQTAINTTQQHTLSSSPSPTYKKPNLKICTKITKTTEVAFSPICKSFKDTSYLQYLF